MSNPQQNDIKNEIEQIKRIINLLQDRLQLNLLQLKRSKKKKKSCKMDKSQLQNCKPKKRQN